MKGGGYYGCYIFDGVTSFVRCELKSVLVKSQKQFGSVVAPSKNPERCFPYSHNQ